MGQEASGPVCVERLSSSLDFGSRGIYERRRERRQGLLGQQVGGLVERIGRPRQDQVKLSSKGGSKRLDRHRCPRQRRR